MTLPTTFPLRLLRDVIIAVTFVVFGIFTFIYAANKISAEPSAISVIYENYIIPVPHLIVNFIMFFASLVYFKSRAAYKGRWEHYIHFAGGIFLAGLLLAITILGVVRIRENVPGPGKQMSICDALDTTGKMVFRPCAVQIFASVLEFITVIMVILEVLWTFWMSLQPKSEVIETHDGIDPRFILEDGPRNPNSSDPAPKRFRGPIPTMYRLAGIIADGIARASQPSESPSQGYEYEPNPRDSHSHGYDDSEMDTIELDDMSPHSEPYSYLTNSEDEQAIRELAKQLRMPEEAESKPVSEKVCHDVLVTIPADVNVAAPLPVYERYPSTHHNWNANRSYTLSRVTFDTWPSSTIISTQHPMFSQSPPVLAT